MKLAVVAFSVAALAPFILTEKSQAQPLPSEYPNVTFFVSSVSGPKGADFGGLAGADKHCQDLAAKVGAGSKTWHAYLSVQATGGATAVNARDRIGRGPWINVNGVQIAANVEDLHSNNKVNLENSLAKTGGAFPGGSLSAPSTTSSLARRKMAARHRRIRMRLAATGPRAAKARPSSVTATAWACATMRRRTRGIRRIPHAAAARRG